MPTITEELKRIKKSDNKVTFDDITKIRSMSAELNYSFLDFSKQNNLQSENFTDRVISAHFDDVNQARDNYCENIKHASVKVFIRGIDMLLEKFKGNENYDALWTLVRDHKKKVDNEGGHTWANMTELKHKIDRIIDTSFTSVEIASSKSLAKAKAELSLATEVQGQVESYKKGESFKSLKDFENQIKITMKAYAPKITLSRGITGHFRRLFSAAKSLLIKNPAASSKKSPSEGRVSFYKGRSKGEDRLCDLNDAVDNHDSPRPR